MNKPKASPLLFLLGVIAIIAIATFFGPEDKALGANVRIVYLHGAWVLTAEIAFVAAALAGALGLLAHFMPALKTREGLFQRWSEALGRTGVVFWVTYLPLSLVAMQSNWNGLFLAEPRFRLALTFAVVGVLLQLGLWIIANNLLTSAANIAYIIVLRIVFASAANIMHPPPSPIFNSGNFAIIGFFVGLNLLAWLAAYFLARWFLSLSSK
ncbi:MAG: hypothetical protein NT121_23255 [Chloroflexi bacterium]|nr:hypothetical protein [Chloroflexota bacterium]